MTENHDPRRRSADTDVFGFLNGGSPAWLRAVYIVGVPSVIALFLVYFLTNSVIAQLTAHSQATEGMRQLLQQHMAQQELIQQENKFYLRQLCLNTARSDEQRAACQER